MYRRPVAVISVEPSLLQQLSGSTCADFKRLGNFPVYSDRLASLVMAGAKTSAQSFSSEAGRTSSGDVLRGIEASSFRTSSIVTSGNVDNFGPVCSLGANIRLLDWNHQRIK